MDGSSPPPAVTTHRLIAASAPAHDVERADVEAVGSVAYRKLYKKREPIYPKAAQGVFRRAKWAILGVLLVIYYATPWIRWDRGPGRPDQAVLVDFAGRRFWFGPIELWPQEIYYITGLLILAALGLFLFTSLFGRVWCGYACPQTVWTDLYLWVERRIEGDRAAQIRLAKQGWTLDKIGKKAVKHAAWLAIAAATGGAWVFYFGDAPTLVREIFTGAASPTTYGFIGLLTFTTYALAGAMREQVCTYMCPWPRIQAAMMDEQSLTVTYRKDRGEPRRAFRKGESWDGRGDCIDCKQCVVVCPQGIDIRDGLQLECINCALCIDACDAVMEKMGRPKGLIAYDTDLNMDRRSKGAPERFDLVRYRTVIYALSMVGVAALMLYSLATRQTLQLNVIRDRNPAFVTLADGSVRNGYTLKIINMQPRARDVTLSIEDAPGAVMTIPGATVAGDVAHLRAAPDAVTETHVFVALPREAVHEASHTITFAVSDAVADADGRIAVDRNPTAFLSGVHDDD
ncbi:MAG: cytochrome c oxidase accessory protein CcoG [Alphaproteobacteria bacterium]|nr:cytochrome c oxidase accessory protein CcoG [Alphaproteobacteria bacterium]